MKGHEKMLAILNSLMMDELTGVEMNLAERLIARVLFLENMPVVSNLGPIHIGADVTAQLKNYWNAEGK